jgi:RNase P subunit RPR2
MPGKRKRGAGFGPSDSTIDRVNDAIADGAKRLVSSGVNTVGSKLTSLLANKVGQKAADLVESARAQTATTKSRAAAKQSGGTIHCLKCKKHTANGKEMTKHTTQKGGRLIKTTCSNCGTKKCRFVGAGFFDDAWKGIKTGVSTATPYVQAAQPYLSTAATLAPLLL